MAKVGIDHLRASNYATEKEAEVLLCKARPPGLGVDGKAAWPIVEADDYCPAFTYRVEGLEL